MKKALMALLAAASAAALLFTVGFFLWRNAGSAEPRFQTPGTVFAVSADADRLNINTADLDTLMTLPGIGPSLAQRILDYRAEHGPFASPADLLQIPGLGEGKLEAILEFITTGGTT